MAARPQVLDVDARLEGWKAIADARNCNVRTAMRRYDRVVRRTKGRVWVMRSRLPAEIQVAKADEVMAEVAELVAELARSIETLVGLVERAREGQR